MSEPTPSIADLATAIRQQQAVLGEVQTRAALVSRTLDAAVGLLRQAATGSNAPDLANAATSASGGKERADAVAAKASAATADLDAYLNAIGAVGGTALGGHGMVHPAVRGTATRIVPRPADAPALPTQGPKIQADAQREQAVDRKQFMDSALTPERLHWLLNRLPDKAREDKEKGYETKTRGFWVDERGGGQSIQSGEHDPDYEAARQYWRVVADRIAPGTWEGIVTTSHAELKAALRLWADANAGRRRHGTIVINHPDGPCSGQLLRCRELLDRFLPTGATLTIYWRDRDGKLKHLLARGTG